MLTFRRALIAADIPWDLHAVLGDQSHMIDDNSSISGLSLESTESDRSTSSMGSSSSGKGGGRKRVGPYGVIAQVAPPRNLPTALKRFSLFGIFDGHGGSKSAEYLQRTFLDRFLERIPSSDCLPSFSETPDLESPLWKTFLQSIRHAAVAAISQCEADFARYAIPSGATISVVLLTGPVATVINLGDSSIWLDTGIELVKVSVDHQVGTNGAELQRLVAAGARLAQLHSSMRRPAYPGETENAIGPLRIWPGGLALSRAFGDLDLDTAQLVLSCPQVTQVAIPHSGCRFVAASDGVWNAFSSDDHVARFLGRLRKSLPKHAVKSLLEETVYRTGLKDDATCLVIEVPGLQDARPFSEVCAEYKGSASKTPFLGGLRDGLSAGLPLAPSGCVVASVDYGSQCPAARSHPLPPLDNVLSVQLNEEKAKSREVWRQSFAALVAGLPPGANAMGRFVPGG